jgi:hypothetical protein
MGLFRSSYLSGAGIVVPIEPRTIDSSLPGTVEVPEWARARAVLWMDGKGAASALPDGGMFRSLEEALTASESAITGAGGEAKYRPVQGQPNSYSVSFRIPKD